MAALRHPEVSAGRAVKVQSFVTTSNGALAELEKQTGGEKWTVQHTPLSKLKELEQTAWNGPAGPSPAATVLTLRRIWVEGGTLYEKTDNEAIGLKPEDMDTLEDAVRSALKAKQA